MCVSNVLDGSLFVQIAGKRYNPSNGVISISCDRHRAREENRRQALHWALRLVETALIEHPSEAWEQIKDMQQEALVEVDQPAPCPFASFMDVGTSTATLSGKLQPLGSQKSTSVETS